ncbi:hypothetical protein CsSME_00029751 [Camellia sinensis var. sinensis]
MMRAALVLKVSSAGKLRNGSRRTPPLHPVSLGFTSMIVPSGDVMVRYYWTTMEVRGKRMQARH